MSDFKNRLQIELNELLDKKNKLTAFLGSKQYDEIEQVQKSLLLVQSEAMETYAMCLYERLNNLE